MTQSANVISRETPTLTVNKQRHPLMAEVQNHYYWDSYSQLPDLFLLDTMLTPSGKRKIAKLNITEQEASCMDVMWILVYVKTWAIVGVD